MSEDIANVEADIEALFAALELAGVVADRARRDAMRLALNVKKAPPRSRQEWEQRAQLRDAHGKDLGWLDTSQARRIDLDDPSGAGDRHVPAAKAAPAKTVQQEAPGSELVEVGGQYFDVTAGKTAGAPEQVSPISVEEAQARIQQRRPDLSTRLIGEQDPRLEVSGGGRERSTDTQAVPGASGGVRQAAGQQQPFAAMRDRAWMAGAVAMTDSWERPGADHDGVRLMAPQVSREAASVVLSPTGTKGREVEIQLRRADGTVHVQGRDGTEMSSVGAARMLGTSPDRARGLIGDAGEAMKAGTVAYDARTPKAAAGSQVPVTAPAGAATSTEPARDTAPTAGPTGRAPGAQQGLSAAEAFGAAQPSREKTRQGESPAAPDTAELVVASTRAAAATASR